MVDWLNQNQGFVTACLTFVYVVATIGIACIMSRSNRLASQNIVLATNLERARSRPYVVFDIMIAEFMVHASVKNIGHTPALNVAISVSPQLKVTVDSASSKQSALTKNPIGFLPPNKEITDFLDVSHSFLNIYKPAVFDVEIRYEGTGGFSYCEEVHLDLEYHRERSSLARKDVARELEELNKHIEKIAQSLGKKHQF